MGTRIAIVDDDENILKILTEVARGDGHEVLGVHFNRRMTIPDAVQAIKSFDPQNIFINHIDGGQLVHDLGFSKEKFIGTSEAYFQDYCARAFGSKYYIGDSSVKKLFLELCATPL